MIYAILIIDWFSFRCIPNENCLKFNEIIFVTCYGETMIQHTSDLIKLSLLMAFLVGGSITQR